MKYVQAVKPEKHNGGAFFEHEIHIDAETHDYQLIQRVKEFMDDSPDQKHVHYRVSQTTRYVEWEPGENTNPWKPKKKGIRVVVVRFQDKNKALMFKLSFVR